MDIAGSPLDWRVIAQIAAPLISLFVGIAVSRYLERRPRLVHYFGHGSSFTLAGQNGAPGMLVHYHAIVLRNVGSRPAKDVRIAHMLLPDFNIFPRVNHSVERNALNGGTNDIVIPSMAPGEELTISYSYFPPHTVSDVHRGIRFEDGFAVEYPVLLQRVYPAWLNYLATALLALGAVAAIYLLWLLVRFGYRSL